MGIADTRRDHKRADHLRRAARGDDRASTFGRHSLKSVHFVKPKSLRYSFAHRSFPTQNHIQVSAINVVVFRKCDLTTFAFDCRS
jgi:hypothetical protein